MTPDAVLTDEELARFKTAFQDKEFCRMFCDYAAEIQSPDARATYEREIQELERERGNAIRWVHPQGEFVLDAPNAAYTSGEFEGARMPLCVNFASSPEMGTPEARSATRGRRAGQVLTIPHCLSPLRRDIEDRLLCDVIFHPDAYADAKLRRHLIEAGIASLSQRLGCDVGRGYTIMPGEAYMGMPHALVIRNSTPHEALVEATAAPANKVECPQHEFVYRERVDIQNYTNSKTQQAPPRELVVRVTLPRVAEVSQVELHVDDAHVVVNVPKLYYSKIPLPERVDSAMASAKWLADRRRLDVACPVNQAENHIENLQPERRRRCLGLKFIGGKR